MKKLFMLLVMGLFIAGSVAVASANLIQNSGFEDNNAWATPAVFADWTASGNYGVTSYAHTGSYAARLSEPASPATYDSLVSDKFNISEMGTYECGAYFALRSAVDPTSTYNNDKAGVTANIYWDAGGAIYPYFAYELSGAPVSSWTQDASGMWMSNWILISGTFDVNQAVLNGELNISLQNWNPIYSAVYVDDAFVQKVPEPGTMILLGTALLGLVGISRKKFRKS